MSSSLDFLKSVWRWKFAGAYVWAACLYTAFIIVTTIQCFIFRTKYSILILLIGYPFLALDIFVYFRTLTVIPRPNSVLHLKEVLWRFGWFSSHALFAFTVIFAFVGYRFSLYYSLISTIMLTASTNFCAFVQEYVFKKKERMTRMDVITKTYIFPVIQVGLFVIFLFPPKGFSVTISGILLYVISDIVCRVCEIIAGEPVSFASIDTTRLASGMESKDDLVKFWAFTDLYLASVDKCSQRREQFFHPSGKCFKQIVGAIASQFEFYSNKQNSICDDIEPAHYSVTRLNDNTLTKDQRRKIYDRGNPREDEIAAPRTLKEETEEQMKKKKEEQSIKNQILRFLKLDKYVKNLEDKFYAYRKQSFDKTQQSMAVKDSFEIIEAVRSIDDLIEKSQTEDKNGILQANIEALINSLLTVSRATKNSAHNIWVDYKYSLPAKRYNAEFIAKDPQELTIKVNETVSSTISKFVVKYGKHIDVSKLSEKNQEEFEVYQIKTN